MSQHLRAMWRTSMDYWMGHRPTETGAPAYDLLAPDEEQGIPLYPDDIYDRPDYYTGFRQWLPETMATLRAARGNPSATITIYRAQKDDAGLNTGDWVTLSRAYAEQDLDSGGGKNDSGRAVEVYRVPASTVRYAGDDLMEWGYWGPSLPPGRTASRTASAEWVPPWDVSTPRSAFNRCKETSALYASHLRKQGEDARWVQLYGRDQVPEGALPEWSQVAPQSISHYVVKSGGRYYDWTARQFDPGAPVPHVFTDASGWTDEYDITNALDGFLQQERLEA